LAASSTSAGASDKPVWHDRPPLPKRCGTLVIGGGITGAALLHWLQGDALLLERSQRLADGASGRNAGFLMAGIASNHAEAVERYGRTRAAEIYGFTVETHRLLAEALSGRAQYLRRGSWRISASEQEALELEQSEALLREDGFKVRYESGRLLTPGDGEHHPAQTVAAIAAPFMDSIRLETAVDRLEGSSTGVRVFADGSECLAETVVLATNAYTAQLLPELPVRPVRGQMLASAPVDRLIVDRPCSADRGFQYWRQRADGSVLVGGYRNLALDQEVGFDERPTELLQQHLERHLRGLGVREPVTHRWAGTMGFTPDELPLAGAVPGLPGIYVCGGYNGHGWAFAFQLARQLAKHLRGGRPLPDWAAPDRFRTPATG
jgi:gamma-glutamylputrescine oxidase